MYNPKTSKPRIGYLKIETMSNKIIEIDRKGACENFVTSDFRHCLEGAYIITQFQMSNDIIKLRVCGSKTAKSFIDAFEYYSLWGIASSALKMLKKEQRKERKVDSLLDKAAVKETFDEKVMRDCQYVSMDNV
jgi:hypothetical protein